MWNATEEVCRAGRDRYACLKLTPFLKLSMHVNNVRPVLDMRF